MPTKPRIFFEVDVFANGPLSGNPLAVVLDGSELTAQQMQAFANWTNFSETTFVLPTSHAEADYQVRIFTPTVELPFAGHPTLGTCHAWLEAGFSPKRRDVIVQQCAIGLVQIAQTNNQLAFAAPPLRNAQPLTQAEIAHLASGFGIALNNVVAGNWCDNGPGWCALLLNSQEALINAKPNTNLLIDPITKKPNLPKLGLIAPANNLGDVQFEVRAFFPGNGVLFEDPVTGSLNAALAQWLIGANLAPSEYRVKQGSALGRDGRVTVKHHGADIWIGGQSITVVKGSVSL